MEPWLARAARMHGERPALSVLGAGAQSYGALLTRARQVAGALWERGARVGDQVALALPSPDLVAALHACTLIGAVAVPIDLRLGPTERAARTSTAKLVLSELDAGTPIAGTERDLTEVATLMFTSGTTSAPKPVGLSYDNWLANALGSALALGLDPDERWLCPMPLAHVGGLSIQLRSAIYGTTVLLHERFDTEVVLEALRDPGQRVTLVSLVPTMLARLLDAGLRAPPTLRWALLGGGPIAPALLARARAAGVKVAPSYGMTEACSQIATNGWPLLGTEVRIAQGEVLVRGRTVAPGALAADGWLHTGDLGSLDQQGRLVIEGRRGDTIITGGENVAPTEVEAVLLEHPSVLEAAVFGRGDPEWGEAVVAWVVLRGDGDRDAADDLRRHCAARLAAYKVPKRIQAVPSLPRAASGKLLRRDLR